MPLNEADKKWITDTVESTVHKVVVQVLGGDREEMRKVEPGEQTRFGNRGMINSIFHTLISGEKFHTVTGDVQRNTDRLVDELD